MEQKINEVYNELQGFRDKAILNLYYILIGVISFASLVFLPLVGIDVGIGWKIPNTTVGWIVWIITKLLISGANVLVFYCFLKQAKVNIKDNEKYKEANEILIKSQDIKNKPPRSPKEYEKKAYLKKCTFIFCATALSTIALTQAILTYNWMDLLTYIFVIIFAIIMGIINMKDCELYWTTEYWEYAKMIENKEKEGKTECLSVTEKNIET